MQYVVDDTAYKKVTRKAKADDLADEIQLTDEALQSTWLIEYFIMNKATAGKWIPDPNNPPVNFPYPFPPIVHWKNLPSVNDCYGISDIEDIAMEGGLQDKLNFVLSNNLKIVRNQAYKQNYTIGMPPKTSLETGMDKLLNFPKDVTVGQMDATADLSGASGMVQALKQALNEVGREVDINSMMDKVGALTNYAVRVMSIDATDKTETKRQLYGEAIEEVNHRLLVMNGMDGEQSDPGKVIWGDPLPSNILEDLQADQLADGLGIAAKSAIYKRYQERYGMTWEEMQKLLDEQSTKANANSANIGAQLLKNFNRGVGVTQGQTPGKNGANGNSL
jgi:hypothetical protein